ncbi:Pycsar system effector family protein [Adhaeribacter terreus]|uniref:Pycsar system effector family protein n=1 Tax=Adhaeribacter terreus TaxID=529703 RepID=A0ABW0EB94_9BACT
MAETESNQEFPALSEEAKTRKKAKKEKKKEKKLAKKKENSLRSMYRTASRNHVSFVAIGDRRANILIGTSTLIISVTFTVFLRKFDEPTIYLVPGLILIITCTATMILAMISTRPYNARGFYTMQEVLTQPVNLLFFENFYKMKVEDYEAAMDKLLESNLDLQHAMVRDLHGLGQSVARKYKFLRISYDVLMIGVILTVLSLLAAMIWKF